MLRPWSMFYSSFQAASSASRNKDGRQPNLIKAINEIDTNWALLMSLLARTINPLNFPGLTALILGGEAFYPSGMAW